MNNKYSGAEWVRSHYEYDNQHHPDKPQKVLSDFGAKIADLLGQVNCGVYHISNDILRADLSTNNYVIMTVGRYPDKATYDNEVLTVLVVLCHDAGIRFEIEPAGPFHLRFKFSQRSRGDDLFNSMPTMDDHIKTIREKYSIPELRMEGE